MVEESGAAQAADEVTEAVADAVAASAESAAGASEMLAFCFGAAIGIPAAVRMERIKAWSSP
ncbi:hypothetical protein ACIA98_39950 [Streptomyces sp. NPDC051366]|uniref:hypothetical protein n=1 Tax=Streptomyces sp. NPDC051366 TaxID=3365652 RepID=UPI0037A629D1